MKSREVPGPLVSGLLLPTPSLTMQRICDKGGRKRKLSCSSGSVSSALKLSTRHQLTHHQRCQLQIKLFQDVCSACCTTAVNVGCNTEQAA